MKTLVLLVLLLTMGSLAQAQERVVETKVATVTAPLVVTPILKKAATVTGHEVARLYRRKNARVNKALSFSTKKSRPKCA